ncbi:MAG: nucleoside triphosphate pyrophosphatase [Oligoflexales bacterium]
MLSFDNNQEGIEKKMAIVKQVILGSGSVFRKQLLASTGLSFISKSSPIDEKTIKNPDPKRLAEERGIAKAVALCPYYPDSLIIGADQTLSLKGKLFEKVTNRAEAKQCLLNLSAQTYYLHTGFCLAFQESSENTTYILHKELIDTPLELRSLSEAEIEAYLDTEEWQDVVGCSRIESIGIHLHTSTYPLNTQTIIGLPLIPLLSAFRKLGINTLISPSPPWKLNLANEQLEVHTK